MHKSTSASYDPDYRGTEECIFCNRPVNIAIVSKDNNKVASYESILTTASLGFPVSLIIVSSGNQAIELFESLHPDLFLIDDEIEGMPSKEVCRWIRAHEGERHTGVIISSSENSTEQFSVECLIVGADDFIRHSCSPAEIVARIHSIFRFKLMTDKLRVANYKLQQMILIDELTGLANMRGFKKAYSNLLHQCKAGQFGLGVIMIDMDHFKSVNDSFNHLVSSNIIQQAGQLIKKHCKKYRNVVSARYGGDEFIISIEAASLGQLFNIADNLRRAFEEHCFNVDEHHHIKLTASIGASWVPAKFNGTPKDVIKLADIMLYKSKDAGRNKVGLMHLRYPIDFDHICRMHRIDRDTSSDDNSISRVYNSQVS